MPYKIELGMFRKVLHMDKIGALLTSMSNMTQMVLTCSALMLMLMSKHLLRSLLTVFVSTDDPLEMAWQKVAHIRSNYSPMLTMLTKAVLMSMLMLTLMSNVLMYL